MVEFELTNEAENLLKLLYSLYRCRREEGKGRVTSNYFESAEQIQRDYLPQMEFEDVFDLCKELYSEGCIAGTRASGSIISIELTYAALVYGEQKFKRNVQELLEWIAAIKGCLPF